MGRMPKREERMASQRELAEMQSLRADITALELKNEELVKASPLI